MHVAWFCYFTVIYLDTNFTPFLPQSECERFQSASLTNSTCNDFAFDPRYVPMEFVLSFFKIKPTNKL